MQYPLKKTYTLYLTTRLFWRVKTVRLEIPQATIRDISEFSQMNSMRKNIWIIMKLKEWGAGKHAKTLALHLGESIENILEDTFFSKKEGERLPDSVVQLATKEGVYDYDSPDSVLFATISSEYSIAPHDLLDYTMDELSYLMNALQYKYLNEAQKKELSRIKIENDIGKNKVSIDKEVEFLDAYFRNKK